MLAGFTNQGTFTPLDALIVGGFDTVTRQITLLSGQNLLRGAVLGKITIPGSATSAVKASGANTGNGALTMDATTPVLPNARVGVYQVRFTSPTAYRVTDPRGEVLGDGANAAAFADQIKFVTAAGGTAFVAGDGFDISLVVGPGKYLLALGAATDGSQVPNAILAEDCNASSGDTVTIAYIRATVDENACIFGAGLNPANARDPLRDVGISLQSSITR